MNAKQISKILLFVILNLFVIRIHGWLFQEGMPLMTLLTVLLHIFALVHFPYIKLKSETNQ